MLRSSGSALDYYRYIPKHAADILPVLTSKYCCTINKYVNKCKYRLYFKCSLGDLFIYCITYFSSGIKNIYVYFILSVILKNMIIKKINILFK